MSQMIDIDEDSQISEDLWQQEIASGFWWRHLVAGGVAGCVSRTCTAPLDRVKIYLQVRLFLVSSHCYILCNYHICLL